MQDMKENNSMNESLYVQENRGDGEMRSAGVMPGLRVLAAGKAAPERVMTNDDLSQIVETSDEWIKTRTGMERRHFCGEGESNTSIAAAAAKNAIQKAGIAPEAIGALVVATLSADNFAPSTACLVQRELGLSDEMICFDLNAACSGFIFGLETVRGLLLQSEKPYAVLVGSEVLSKKLDMTDRSTCVLFGDGAGAVVLALDESRTFTSRIGCHGDDAMICCPAGEETNRKIHMDGQATYKFAVRMVPALIRETADKAKVTLEDIDIFLLHQANARIIDAVARTLKLPRDKFFGNIEEYGNTSAASVAIALCDAMEQGVLGDGKKVLLAGFGAGRTWGAVVMEI
jgi:3-oxoacyl-[acyl-carrier-protein] synthase-3